jgi:hypothetical protein
VGINGKAVIELMKDKGYKDIRAVNLVGVEGIADDGIPNSDQIDLWNDTILVVRDSGEVLLESNGTTEPGAYYVQYPMNTKGCAFMSFGQHRDAWEFGYHNWNPNHPALVQTGEIKVIRDNSGRGSRANGTPDVGLFGVNIHGTMGNHRANSIGQWSAGCIVTRSWVRHTKMLQLMKDSGRDRITFTLLDGTELAKFCQATKRPLAL